MHIPFVDLKSQYHSLKPEMDAAIASVLEDTAFIGGTHVSRFEEEFSRLYGVKHCISVANGTDSLYIIMKMLGIGTGDEVITAANSWISSSETISQTGATPVFADVHPGYYSMDETLLEALITPRTRAIIPVHLHGQMVNMDAVMDIAARYKLHVIEDCAQSHFSEFRGKRAGTMGIAGSFSFYPGKNLGAYGDAGCIITNDDELAEKCRMYARHGALQKHKHEIEGINSRMDGLQAAVLNVKLPHILRWTESRIRNAAAYTHALKGIGDLVLPVVRPDSMHTFHLYVIRTARRNELAIWLKEKGIETAIHYPTALPLLPAYSRLGLSAKDFPVSASHQDQILSLPMYPELTVEMIEYIAGQIKMFFN
ncbi:MAG: DegT/DnrJ/EryC1/StrS family aminotransferase [Bacteroidetes bacterium]|nr:DegT/DnrJ/EryC1/StrS family aminotransferase [Bacteroidota bacterium]